MLFFQRRAFACQCSHVLLTLQMLKLNRIHQNVLFKDIWGTQQSTRSGACCSLSDRCVAHFHVSVESFLLIVGTVTSVECRLILTRSSPIPSFARTDAFFVEASLLKNSGGLVFWHVHDLTFSGVSICSESQIFVMFTSKVEQQISVRFSCSVLVSILCIATVVRVQLFREVCQLTVVAWIFEQHDVPHVQTDRPRVFVLVQKVLHHEHDGDVSVVRSACEHVTVVDFTHRVFEHNQWRRYARSWQVLCPATENIGPVGTGTCL